MTAIHETAYPRIRSNITEKELNELYTPTQEQLEFADRNAREPIQKLGLLILVKTFQRLGYFPTLNQIPQQVIQHIACCARLEEAVSNINNYEKVGSRRRHKSMIRAMLGVEAFGDGGEQILKKALVEACYTKDIIADIINAGIEELVRQRYELPGFNTLLRAAITARTEVNRGLYQKVCGSLSANQKELIRELLVRDTEDATSNWERLKQDTKRTTVKNMRELIEHLNWLKSLNAPKDIFNIIPESKLHRLSDEARSLNIAQMNEMEEAKRFTLVTALVRSQTAQVIDDLADMFIHSVKKLHNNGSEALNEYHRLHQDKADSLIEVLSRLLTVINSSQNTEEQMKSIRSILGDDTEEISKACEIYLGYAGNNYLPFLLKFYRSQRSNLFEFLTILRPKSTSSDTVLEESINFLITNRNCHRKNLNTGIAPIVVMIHHKTLEFEKTDILSNSETAILMCCKALKNLAL